MEMVIQTRFTEKELRKHPYLFEKIRAEAPSDRGGQMLNILDAFIRQNDLMDSSLEEIGAFAVIKIKEHSATDSERRF